MAISNFTQQTFQIQIYNIFTSQSDFTSSILQIHIFYCILNIEFLLRSKMNNYLNVTFVN